MEEASGGIAAFIAARLDEDEAAAKEAASRPRGPAWDDGTRHTAVARHINRHDPARVLREVEAKRAILAEHELVPAGYRGEGPIPGQFGCRTCHCHEYGTDPEGPCRTLLLLAAVWSDHPDYAQLSLPSTI